MHPLYILIGVWLQGFQRDCCKSFKTVTQKIVLIRCVVVPVYMLQPWSAEAWYAHFNSCLAGSMLNDTISGSATLQCHDQKSWSMSQRHDPQPLSSSNVRIALIDSLWRLILSKLFCCSLAQGSRLPQPSDWWRFSKMSRFEVGSSMSQCHEQVLTSQLCGDPPLQEFEGYWDLRQKRI